MNSRCRILVVTSVATARTRRREQARLRCSESARARGGADRRELTACANDHVNFKNDDRGDLQPFAEDQNLESARRLVNRFRKKVFVDIHAGGAIRNARVRR